MSPCERSFDSRSSFKRSPITILSPSIQIKPQVNRLDSLWASHVTTMTIDAGKYTENMDYSVGSRVRVRLYSGEVVEAEITAITNQVRATLSCASMVALPETLSNPKKNFGPPNPSFRVQLVKARAEWAEGILSRAWNERPKCG